LNESSSQKLIEVTSKKASTNSVGKSEDKSSNMYQNIRNKDIYVYCTNFRHQNKCLNLLVIIFKNNTTKALL